MGDVDRNISIMAENIEECRNLGVDIAVFPECMVSGYPAEDLWLKRDFVRVCRESLHSLAERVSGPVVIAGTPWLDTGAGTLHNAAAVLANHKIQDVYFKRELPNYGVFDEKRYFEPGKMSRFFQFENITIGITICEDVWVAGNNVERETISASADLVLNLSASPFHRGKNRERERILQNFTRATRSTLVYCNLVGGQDELVFDGGGAIVDSGGKIIHRSPRFIETIGVFDLTFPPRESPPPFPSLLRNTTPEPKPTLAVPSPVPDLPDLEETYEALVLGLRDYILKNKFKKVVLGLSGGIDSSLTAAIAVDALGKENVIGVSMPSRYTSGETLSDAEQIAKNLGIPCHIIPIEPLFKTCFDSLKEILGYNSPTEGGLDLENLQARIRGVILMTLSNRFGWIVITTGNKSETAVGYSTLYGDTAGGFAIIKDVPKTLVYELSHYVNEKSGREVIPSSVIERPPTAELRPCQKDQDSLPPYDVLDRILTLYIEENKSPVEIRSETGFEINLVREIVRKVDRNEYKRRQSPPGIKITPLAFGKERRMPVTNVWTPGN